MYNSSQIMYLDFNRKCPDIEHPDEKHPLIGIEASGAGIKYRYACGIGEIIQISGAGQEKLLEISNQLRKHEGKSLDELYEELTKSYDDTNKVKYEKKVDYRREGEVLFQGLKENIRKALCDDFGLCKKLPYLQGGITQLSAVAIADALLTSIEETSLHYLVIIVAIIMNIPLIQLKKWCNCP